MLRGIYFVYLTLLFTLLWSPPSPEKNIWLFSCWMFYFPHLSAAVGLSAGILWFHQNQTGNEIKEAERIGKCSVVSASLWFLQRCI